MKPRQRRLKMLALGMAIAGFGLFLILYALRDNLLYFRTPSELLTMPAPPLTVRLGGLVEKNSVSAINENTIRFKASDGKESVSVEYSGPLPVLFREGQGVVAEGTWNPEEKLLTAHRILAKHDERYMPPEVAAALKESGHWHGESQTAP